MPVLGVVLGGCGSSGVDVPPPTVAEGAVVNVCEELAAALPEVVGGVERRETEPTSARTAAWGDPPIVLRCGVPRPAALTPTTPDLVEVNGVTWLLEELDDGYRFTTSDRGAFVEVTVPDDYAPEVNPLVDLADPIGAAVPTTGG